jgi:hypothetical protein
MSRLHGKGLEAERVQKAMEMLECYEEVEGVDFRKHLKYGESFDC